MTLYEKLRGKTIDVDYETGYHFLITFNSESELTWKALSKRAEGAPETESEPYKSYEIEEGIYMVNWIEETGLVVSQIQDYNTGKVYAYMTWNDDKARGKRAELMHKGELKIL